MAGDNCRNGRSNWTMTQGDHGVCCDWFCGRLINRPATQEAPRGWRIPSRDTPQQGTRNQFCSFLLVHRFVRRLAMVTWTFHEPGTTQKKKTNEFEKSFSDKISFRRLPLLAASAHLERWNFRSFEKRFLQFQNPGTHRSVDQRKIVNIPKNSNFAIKVKYFFLKKNIPQFEKTLARENLYSSIVVTLNQ